MVTDLFRAEHVVWTDERNADTFLLQNLLVQLVVNVHNHDARLLGSA